MIAKYSLFIFCVLVMSFVAAAFIKPVNSGVDINSYKDPFAAARSLYAKLAWRGLEKEKDPVKKFNIVSKITDYDPSFKPAYNELCSSYDEYIKSDINVKDLLRILRTGAERFNDDEITQCYIKILTGMERYTEVIDFLKRMRDEIPDAENKKIFAEKVSRLQHEKNVLDITKAVELYYQRTKSYPGDILVLVNEGLIDKIPDDPYGGQYYVSKQGQVRTTSDVENGARGDGGGAAHGVGGTYE
ncbi:MAG: hypothetical protein V1647_02665 [Pseudomonadota bacterium]